MSGVAARHAAPLALVLLTLASAGVRFWAGRGVDLPWIAPDETIYALLGRSLWEDGWPSLLGTASSSYSFVYPALIGLPLAFGDLAKGVIAVQALGALLMSATACVVYLWGRGPLGAWWAVAAAGLTLAVPDLAYSGLVMSEVAIFPIATLALWAIAAAIARPSLARQALVGGAIVLALATHVRLVALIPTLFVAVALQCGFVRSLEPARRLVVLLAGTAGASAVLLVGFAIAGRWHDLFGAYAAAAGGYELQAAAKDVVWHAGGVFVVVAGVPLIALAAMSIECVAQRVRDPAAAALVATTAAWTSCLVLEIGTFASRWVGHVALRDLQPVVPPLMLVFALWIARGTPRRAPWFQAAAFAVAAGALVLPVRRFSTQESALDAVSMIPLWRLAEATSGQTLELVYALSVGALVALAVFLPQRARFALPVIVAVVLITLSVLSTREINRLTQLDRAWVFDVGDPRWVDGVGHRPRHISPGKRVSCGSLEAPVLEPPDRVGRSAQGSSRCRPADAGERGASTRRRDPAYGWTSVPARSRRRTRGLRPGRGTDCAGSALDGSRRTWALARRPTATPAHVADRRPAERRRHRDGGDHGVQLRPWKARADAARQAGDADRGPGERHHVGGAEGRLGRGLDRQRPCPTRRGRPLVLPLRAGEPGAGRLDPARVRA